MLFCCLHGNLGQPADWEAVRLGLRAAYSDSLAFHAPRLWSFLGPDWRKSLGDYLNELSGHAAHPRILIGYSLGARLALQAIACGWGSWDGLILCSANPGIELEDDRRSRRAADEQWARRFENTAEALSGLFADWNRQAVLSGSVPLAWQPGPDFSDVEARSCFAAAFRYWSQGVLENLWSLMSTLGLPTLCLAGEHDPKYRNIASRISAYANPNVRTITIPGCGHRIPIDQPSALTQAIVAFTRDLGFLANSSRGALA